MCGIEGFGFYNTKPYRMVNWTCCLMSFFVLNNISVFADYNSQILLRSCFRIDRKNARQYEVSGTGGHVH